jgi:hypothetical protein
MASVQRIMKQILLFVVLFSSACMRSSISASLRCASVNHINSFVSLSLPAYQSFFPSSVIPLYQPKCNKEEWWMVQARSSNSLHFLLSVFSVFVFSIFCHISHSCRSYFSLSSKPYARHQPNNVDASLIPAPTTPVPCLNSHYRFRGPPPPPHHTPRRAQGV